jgi:guanine deaminase
MTEAQVNFMKRAIQLSRQGMQHNQGGPFGSVIVKAGKIIGEGNNHVISTNDPTAHAEIVAIRDACSKLNTYDLSGCEIYCSCEPCPMCLSAIYWARIGKIYFANNRKDAAAIGFDDDLIYTEIPKPVNERKVPAEMLLREEAIKVFEEWRINEDRTTS